MIKIVHWITINNLLSYCGLIYATIRTSDKNLSVHFTKPRFRLTRQIQRKINWKKLKPKSPVLGSCGPTQTLSWTQEDASILKWSLPKGQTNSKWFFQADVSSKKQTNEFNFTTTRLAFVHFSEDIEDAKDINRPLTIIVKALFSTQGPTKKTVLVQKN